MPSAGIHAWLKTRIPFFITDEELEKYEVILKQRGYESTADLQKTPLMAEQLEQWGFLGIHVSQIFQKGTRYLDFIHEGGPAYY